MVWEDVSDNPALRTGLLYIAPSGLFLKDFGDILRNSSEAPILVIYRCLPPRPKFGVHHKIRNVGAGFKPALTICPLYYFTIFRGQDNPALRTGFLYIAPSGLFLSA